MEWGTPVWWGWFLLFSRSGGHKTKETYPTRPGSPTPCKQGLSERVKFLIKSISLIDTANKFATAFSWDAKPLRYFILF